MYLDILEGDARNLLPARLGDGETATVAVAIQVTTNSPDFKVISAVTATLTSENGLFAVASPTSSLGSLTKGQAARAAWAITSLATGTDRMMITVEGVNLHGPTYYVDSYSPSPSIEVERLAPNHPPSISLTSPAPGSRLSGGSPVNISWTVQDEDPVGCLVDLFYTDGDAGPGELPIASGLPAPENHTWSVPRIDSGSVALRAVVRDRNGNSNGSPPGGPLAIDSTPPSVLSVLPADGDGNVTDSAIMQVVFSEPVDADTALTSFRIEPDPGGLSWTWNGARTTMTAIHDPFGVGTTYRCRLSPGVTDLSSPGNAAVSAFNWSFTTPEVIVPMPSIVLVGPGGGDRSYWDDRLAIRWTASSRTGALSIDLSVSENGTAGPFVPLASGLPNSGRCELATPRLVSDRCIVEARAYDQGGKEARSRSGAFSIAQDLSLGAEFPSPGIPLLAGSPVRVMWATTGGAGNVVVNLSLSADRSSTPRAELSNLSRSGFRDWLPPELNTETARLFLTATDAWGRTASVSSGELSIYATDPPPPPPPPPRRNQPPVVLFGPREGRVFAGVEAHFDASASTDPDNDPLHFIWDFGDGTDVENTTAPERTHTYIDAGNYTLTLTVGDGQNETRQSMTVHVEARAGTGGGSGRDRLLPVLPGILVILAGILGVAWEALGRPRPPAGRGGRGGGG